MATSRSRVAGLVLRVVALRPLVGADTLGRRENSVAYLILDLEHFVGRAPYLALARPETAARFLQRQLELLSQSYTALEQYPAVRVEPLEFFYSSLRSLAVLDASSLCLMLTELNWRGVVWGGWLALLDPRHDFAEVLSTARTPRRENLWAVQCALAFLERSDPPSELRQLYALARDVRDTLRDVPVPRVLIRNSPTEMERASLAALAVHVRAAYRTGGVSDAQRVLRGTRLYELSIPYERWRVEYCNG